MNFVEDKNADILTKGADIITMVTYRDKPQAGDEITIEETKKAPRLSFKILQVMEQRPAHGYQEQQNAVFTKSHVLKIN